MCADNESITAGYRSGGLTLLQALRSFFTMHNETLNIWTHAVGACVFVWLITRVLLGRVPAQYGVDYAALGATLWRGDFEPKEHWLVSLASLGRGGTGLVATPAAVAAHSTVPLVSPPDDVTPATASVSHVAQWPLVLTAASAAICFTISVAFHGFHVVSHQIPGEVAN